MSVLGFGAPSARAISKRFLSPESAAKDVPCSVLHVIGNDDYGTDPLPRPRAAKGNVAAVIGRSKRQGMFAGRCTACGKEGTVSECWHCGETFCAQAPR